MVAFPASANEGPQQQIMAPMGKEIVLGFEHLEVFDKEKTRLDLPSVDHQPEPAIVKKIAAGLKSGLGVKESNGKCPDIGSLSSGSSIVTICSVTNSEPEPDLPGYPTKKPEDAEDSPQKKQKKSRLIVDETWYHTALQISVPFFIAGIGTIGAGLVLAKVKVSLVGATMEELLPIEVSLGLVISGFSTVGTGLVLAEIKDWQVFMEVSQIFILVPALLGLKGNLDMCLASRLSTQANLGNMKSYREVLKMIVGNIALVQVQAIVAATLVSIFATAVSYLTDNSEFSWEHTLLITTSSICTATSSCFILDFAMVAVIMGAHHTRMNPDNLATPLAASIGDVVSISVLSLVASTLFPKIKTDEIWILYALLAVFLVLLPIWITIVYKNKYTRNVLTSGWVPVISALFISGLGGLVLDKAVNSLNGFVIFQPIINGIGGNLVSIQASRISTMLHQSTIVGILPPWTKTWISPWKALFGGVPSAKTAMLLVAMSIPGHVAFSFIADYIQWQKSTIHIYFMVSYLTVAVLQVMFLLYIAHIMIHVMWKYKIDPDNSAIPYLTALGDLSGSVLLALAFIFLLQIDHQYHKD